MPKTPNKEIQAKAVAHVTRVFRDYSTLLNAFHSKCAELFRDTYQFEVKGRKAAGQSQIFFPKCFEQVEKVAPRIYGNKPKFVVSLNVPVNNVYPEADMSLNMEAVQKALNYYWNIGRCQKKGRTWVKGALVYGTMWAEVMFEKTVTEDIKRERGLNEDGEEIEIEIKKEMILNEYPTFEVPDILDMYFDPRIEFEDDMPAIIKVKDGVRFSDLYADKDRYFNIEKIRPLTGTASDTNTLKTSKFNDEGIPTVSDEDTVNIKTFYGYFSETDKPEDEELYKIMTVNDSEVIYYKKLDFLPWVKFNAIEVPNQGVGLGLVEPITKLQEAYNLTRNQRAENVSLVLNRMWVMKQNAGVDPRKLVSRAGNVITVKDMDGLAPLPTPDITQSAFAEANAINTEIQQTLGTIDTTQDQSDNGFTNLATGQKIRWQEYNVRFKAIKENFEEALGRLGEKMLLMVGKEANQNPLIGDVETQKFFEVAKTAFDQVSDFYTISVYPDSTANDSLENKRDETLAFGQLAIAYKAQGVPINMEKVFVDIAGSFPGKNPQDYIEQQQPATEQQGGNPMSAATMESIKTQPSPEDQLNNQLTNVG